MDCGDIQEKLSAYIEGIISSEEKALIEEHLKSCQKCSESLADLRKTMEYVKDLEEIEPPAWLTQRVIARVRSEVKPKKGILQKMFYPLYIKIPLEAAAAILIAVTAVYIFKTIQPEVKLAKIPSEEIATQIPSQEKGKTPPTDESKKNIIPPSPPLEKGDKRGFEAEQTMPLKKPETMDKLAVPKAPVFVTKQEEIRSFAGALTKDEPSRETLSAAPKAKTLAERKIENISLTVNVKDVETCSKEIEKTLMQCGGKVIKTEFLENKIVLLAEIHPKAVNGLIEKLKLIGEVKEEGVDLEGLKGNIEIKIKIVKR
ncbi:MAG: zf-HC2 domain-containing protein [Nitrospirota bacterium]